MRYTSSRTVASSGSLKTALGCGKQYSLDTTCFHSASMSRVFFAGYEDNHIDLDMRFSDGRRRLLVLSDKGIAYYSMNNGSPSKKWEK